MARLSLCKQPAHQQAKPIVRSRRLHLISLMLANNKYPIAQRKPLFRIIRDRGIKRSAEAKIPRGQLQKGIEWIVFPASSCTIMLVPGG